MASTTFDFPDPLGPTTTLTLLDRSILTFSANDLKPFTTIDFKYIVTLLLLTIILKNHEIKGIYPIFL